MKKFILVLSFYFACIHANKAQNYIPFPENSAVWDIYLEPSEPDIRFEVHNRYTMKGDTVINNRVYNKVYCSRYTITYPPRVLTLTELGYCFAIRQDIVNKKVYRTLDVNNTIIDTLLYDYNLKIGDTVPETFTTPKKTLIAVPQTVTFIDSVTFHGKKFRRFHLSLAADASLIEGVGNANGLIEDHFGFFEGGNVLVDFCTSEYSDCTVPLTLNVNTSNKENDFLIFPNPFTDKLTVIFHDESMKRDVMIVDLLGKEVQAFNHIGKELLIDRGSMIPGVYFLKITDKDKVSIKKIVVQE